MSWEYRIVEHKEFYDIREVFLDEDGEILCVSNTASLPAGESSLTDLREDLQKMVDAFEKPIVSGSEWNVDEDEFDSEPQEDDSLRRLGEGIVEHLQRVEAARERPVIDGLREYRRRPTATVVAVQLNFEMEGFVYYKWGGRQVCKGGDWVVRNGDDTYTVDSNSFAETYQMVSPGVYAKVGSVWAKFTNKPGEMATKEGFTMYKAGSYIVYNDKACTDGYAMDQQTFEKLYEPVSTP